MSGRPELKLDWCTHEAAKYAVKHWHYSQCLPSFKRTKIGVWEDLVFVGCVVFSMGAAPHSHCPFGIARTELCELTRVALRQHSSPVSRIIAIALRMIKRQSPGLRLVVSYADPEKGHHGGIYAAGGWLYLGRTSLCEQFEYVATGQRVHTKTIKTGKRGRATKLKEQGVIRSVKVWKHKYAMPLDAAMRAQLEPLRKPYPNRAGSAGSGTPGDQPGGGGATPTSALSVSRQPERE